MLKYIKIIRETIIKKYSNIVNLLPASSLGQVIFQYKADFNSELYKVNYSQFVNVFRVKNFVVDTSLNLFFSNELNYNKFNPVVIWESLDGFIYKKIFKHNDGIKKTLKKNIVKIESTQDHLYFSIKNNKPNHYHFIEDNLVALVDFLENYNDKFTLVYLDDISKSLNQYIELLSKIYNFDTLAINKKNNYQFKKLIFYDGNQIKRLRNLDNYEEINDFKSENVKMEYSVYSVPKLYKIEDIDNKKTYTVGNASRFYLNSNNSYKSYNQFINKLLDKGIINQKSKRKILILRDEATWKKYKPNAFNTKNILNLEELKKRAKDYEVIYLENLNIIEQIELFYNSSHVICVSGAALTNIIYSQKNTKVFELRPKYYGIHYNYFEDIAKERMLDYKSIICDCTTTNDITLTSNQIDICANN